MENTHRTFPATSSMCTAVAAAVEGTVVHEVSRAATTERLRLGHPAGIMESGRQSLPPWTDWEVESVTTQRTARRIMEGVILVPQRAMEGKPWFEDGGRMNLTHKLIKSHLVSGDMTPGEEIALRIDQTLSQDATGTLSYLQFEAIGVPRVRTQLSVSYVDHNMLQGDFRNADDHVYLQDVAAKYGLYYSRPGNGICHQVHLERFAVPGTTLLGTDSHTPTCGGMGVLAIGAGGLDVAIAMAGSPYYLRMPRVLGVELHGRLQPGVTAKDIIFEILRRLTVKGGVGQGAGILRAGRGQSGCTGARDHHQHGGGTRRHHVDVSQRRAHPGLPQAAATGAGFFSPGADPDATYDEHMRIDLDTLEPLIARPDSPDNVCPISEVAAPRSIRWRLAVARTRPIAI